MRRRAIALFASAAAALVLSACGGDAEANEVTLTIRYSHFVPEVITATAGEPVTINLQNDDPIEHEWLVGDDAMHERHRTGTEPFHDSIPTEVTLRPLSTQVTTVTFEEPGDYLYVCHLPGHEAYGMVGTLRVVEG